MIDEGFDLLSDNHFKNDACLSSNSAIQHNDSLMNPEDMNFLQPADSNSSVNCYIMSLLH